MYLDQSTVKRGGKSYTRVLLRESYREKGKVKKRTIANLSKAPEKEVEAIRLALKYKDNLSVLGASGKFITLSQGMSIGATWLIYEVARRLGAAEALGSHRQGKLALWQIIARIIGQGSRLSAVRLADGHGACDALNLDSFNEDDLYENLDWLSENQAAIEDRLFEKKKNKNSDFFLYDSTSSYLEGDQNQLAAFGYNRDKKRGKKQIVIGLLCDKEGEPVSVEVFNGNTKDTETFKNQVVKVRDRFSGRSITFVGDKGMIKGPQIKELGDSREFDLHYITSITKPQIEKLLKKDMIQLGFFDRSLAEIETDDGVRLILRRNPMRAEEMGRSRREKLEALSDFVADQNLYLKEHVRAQPEVALRKAREKNKGLRLDKWATVSLEGERSLTVLIDEEEKEESSKLDGCYVLKTDLSKETASKETVHDRYKDLALVEKAFRTQKTAHLEVRPIHVRLARRTRGHVFVVMLAYLIVRELTRCWKDFNITVEEGIAELNSLCSTEVSVKDGGSFNKIPEPRELSRKLLEAAKVKMPEILPSKGIVVSSKKQLSVRRKGGAKNVK